MIQSRTLAQTGTHDPDQSGTSKTLFGFWVYLMTDLVLFATLFATYAVLRDNTFGGPSGKELFSLPYVLVETLVLLTSSFTAGLGLLAARRGVRKGVILWFGVTFALGAVFLGMELNEFSNLVRDGHGWQASGFLSAFFTLVGTHGAHITAGLLWMGFMMLHILKRGLTDFNIKRLAMLSMFWHFLDIVWIFIFTFVFLMGAV